MKWLDKTENVFLSLATLLGVLVVVLSVALRWFGFGFAWGNEFVRYLFIWVTFIGASVCIRTDSHIGITLLPEILKGLAKRVLLLTFDILMLIFSVYVFFWLGLEMVLFNYATQQVTPALQFPVFIIYLCIPIAGLLMSLRSIQNIISLLRGKPIDESDKDEIIPGVQNN